MSVGIEQRYFTLKQFALLSGLSASTIHRRVKDGSIRALQPGGTGTLLLFPADALEALRNMHSTTHDGTMSSSDTVVNVIKPITGRRPKWMDD